MKVVNSGMKKKYSRRTVLAGILGAGAIGVGAATTIDTEIFPTVKVSYGEVTYEASDVSVADYQLNGPGINVNEVAVDLENLAADDIEVSVEVFLTNSGSVIESGTQSATVPAESTITKSIAVPQTRSNQFNQVDIRVTEE